jgi:hypothetical protein
MTDAPRSGMGVLPLAVEPEVRRFGRWCGKARTDWLMLGFNPSENRL